MTVQTDREQAPTTSAVRRPLPERRDGFLDIGAYAAIGDGRTVALVGADGSIDWLPVPTVDAPPLIAGILDPEAGGHIRLGVPGAQVTRRYVPGTNVLETTFVTDGGSARVTDSLNVGGAGRLPWIELARRVEGLDGEVDLAVEIAPGDRFATARPWIHAEAGTTVVHRGDQNVAVVADGITWRHDGYRLVGQCRATPGRRHLLALVATDGEPVPVPAVADIDGRIDATVEAWRRWRRGLALPARWAAAVERSALALKLLIFAPTGAVTAAPITSLPEAIGGKRNFDYRFAWIRDSSFVVEALHRLGLLEEEHAALSWLLGTVSQTAPDLHVFYSLDGTVVTTEREVPFAGYRGSRPVRSGNGAAGQRQLGTFGDLLESLWRYARRGQVIDEATGALVSQIADRACDLWRQPDAGLWELHDRRQYTSSKIGCWAALDRACRLAEQGQVPDHHRDRWESERAGVTDWVNRHCWSASKGAYRFHADTDDLDAAVLLAARTGFDRGERLSATVDAVRRELGRGPLLYRYSGMQEKEGAFLACSFWLVEALGHLGRTEEATDLMDELVGEANDVGLMSEEKDPSTGELLGNFPLGLSHLALVNAAFAVTDGAGGD